jgi:hypothetical protein
MGDDLQMTQEQDGRMAGNSSSTGSQGRASHRSRHWYRGHSGRREPPKWPRGFNWAAGLILVAVATVALAGFAGTGDTNELMSYLPWYVLVLLVIGAFLFSKGRGKWATTKMVAVGICVFVVLPLYVLIRAMISLNTPVPVTEMDRQVMSNSVPVGPR